jgi:3-oxoacyl-ACP reductase-like protein
MAEKTLATMPNRPHSKFGYSECHVLSHCQDLPAIEYNYENPFCDDSCTDDRSSEGDVPRTPTATPQPIMAATTGGAVPVLDMPLSALDVLVSLTGAKMKKAFDLVPTEKSLKFLAGGKFTSPKQKSP